MPSWRRNFAGLIRRGPSASPRINIPQADAHEILQKSPTAPLQNVQYADMIPKMAGYVDGSGVIIRGVNLASVTRVGAGIFNCKPVVAFADTNLIVVLGVGNPTAINIVIGEDYGSRSTTNIRIHTTNPATAENLDPNFFSFVVF